ncbi:lipoprotein [Burkholderia aenigmatica]|uniref:Lipoprotein n=1 Tax=Burkholderia aenigmatica TaxID=2015348 RepID=A0A6P2KK23_9BURK|nr:MULTISPECIES: outer membrane protein assembly factor BamE [Burkholderia]MDN7516494.1 outer membrane protein assembly factor BamE [Burkholderia sp. AU45251]VWB56113.1 lipoprotein [Burkholderia aenigmatica]HDR9483481.1 outer membrane protein assembly factor BamE [Burkholderia aenigmatica]HDR9514430.1 outer membrane protein assembly factor BamE [Burkholderia aenigmatica]HDR9520368.1 outer membrane protein assembly factor BamE [Burkholderia aenigmatica]
MRKPILIALTACAFGFLLTGCDDQKMADAVNAIKPDNVAFGSLQRGVSTVDDVLRAAGKPEMVRQNEDGSQRYEYPRGPFGTSTYMLDFGPDGRLMSITQALSAENIAKVVPGMTKDDVRQLLGKPTSVSQYALSHEEVWSWHWAEGGVSGDAMFNAHFSPDGIVIRTSRSEAPGREKP